MFTFCTYFDSRYLTRGLALWESLMEHVAEFELHVLCLDDDAYDSLQTLALPRIVPMRLSELEEADPALLQVKPTRSTVEYYFTLSPALPLHIFHKRPQAEFVTYLDADLRFYGPIDPLFEELGGRSIGIIRHRFPPAIAFQSQWGVFNVGCVIFRNDERARACLQWWRERCLEWCYDRLEGDRFADQKYLDQWPQRFQGVAVLEHAGANVAPWNIGGSTLTFDGGRFFVDGMPLLFYHYHGLRRWNRALWQLGFGPYHTRPSRLLVNGMYRPYIARLNAWSQRVREDVHTTIRRSRKIRLRDILRAPLNLIQRELIVVV